VGKEGRTDIEEAGVQDQANIAGRHVVATFATYAEAERAVDSLSDDGFPIEQLTIVSDQLRLVENVTGRRGYGQEALDGAAAGAVVGALLGFILGVFSLIDPLISGLALAIYGALIGGAIGGIVGALAHWLSAGRRDFASVRSVEAGRYEVMADTAEHAEEAARALASRTASSSR